MKNIKITYDKLKKLKAHEELLAQFERSFGKDKEVEFTIDLCKKHFKDLDWLLASQAMLDSYQFTKYLSIVQHFQQMSQDIDEISIYIYSDGVEWIYRSLENFNNQDRYNAIVKCDGKFESYALYFKERWDTEIIKIKATAFYLASMYEHDNRHHNLFGRVLAVIRAWLRRS